MKILVTQIITFYGEDVVKTQIRVRRAVITVWIIK